MSKLLRSKRAIPYSQAQLSLFLRLPSSCRSFHASPRPQFLEAGILATHELLEGLHSITGLPWGYTLPLAALTLRTTFVLPLAIYSRRIMRKQAALNPLVLSWQHQLKKETVREVGHAGPKAAQRVLLKKTIAKRNEIYKRWGCGRWKVYAPMVQLPIWLLAIETIRKMCGTRSGILGMIFGSAEQGKDIPEALDTSGVLKEMSFATEGIFWFPDLLVPDPMLILPFMLSGTILLNLSSSGLGKTPERVQGAFRRRLQNSLKIVALAIGPLTLQIPSGMLVYWISSSFFAYAQAMVLEKLMPIKSVQPCKPKNRIRQPEDEFKDTI